MTNARFTFFCLGTNGRKHSQVHAVVAFSQQWQLEKSGGRLGLVSASGQQLWLQHLSGGELITARGQEEPRLQGWVTETYGKMVERQSVGFSSMGEDVQLYMVLAYDEAGLDEAVSVLEVVNGDSEAIN